MVDVKQRYWLPRMPISQVLSCSFPIRYILPVSPSGCAQNISHDCMSPVFFVQGSADPFGTPAELEYAITLIPGPTQLLVVEGAGHDLKRGRIDLEPVIAVVLDNRAPRASEQLNIRDGRRTRSRRQE